MFPLRVYFLFAVVFGLLIMHATRIDRIERTQSEIVQKLNEVKG